MTDFVGYIKSLAQQGETALFVKQKPSRDAGKQRTHKDGSLKYTWPAFLEPKGGGAIYGNTGSFIIDRFIGGKPSASAANIEYVLCMVLDDIGTKSKTPPLEPTWIMETSPGNYQWGYTFSEQPTKGDFCAAITAIAAAGYSDKGATNAVRNFRIPGSINLKDGNNNFASRLVEFHPEREFDLDQICDALGVTPAEASTASIQPIRLQDDGNDDVLAWLNQHSLILDPANSSGWLGIVCPNSAAHSDGNPMARYHPVNRSFCCYHEHCTDLNSEAFLHWVEDNGGPSRQSGLRDDLLASTMQKVYDSIDKGNLFSKDTEAEAVIAEVEKKQLSRLEKNQLHEHFAYVEPDDGYFDMVFRREYKRSTFDAIYRHLDTRSMHGKGSRVNAGVWFDEQRHGANGKSLAGITYAPGESVLCAKDGLVYGNKWVNGRTAGKKGDVGLWLELLNTLVPDPAEQEHILNVFAYKRQHPEHKINHAILLIGQPGIGKDTLYAPFLYSIGGNGQRNVHIVKGEELTSQFSYGMENEVLVLNELRQTDGKDRRAMENHLKPIIAAPPEYLTVNRKGMHPYEAVNRILVLAGSNYPVPINLPSDDRRWFVVKSNAAPLSPVQARNIWDWYKQGGGFDAVTAYLEARDVSMFNPGATPMMTEAKEAMIEQGLSASESFLVEMIRNREGEFAPGIVGGPFHKLLDTLQGRAPSGAKLHLQTLLHAFQEAGWKDAGKVYSMELPSRKHVFCAPDMANMSKSGMRRAVEPAPVVMLKAVK